ncbi:hypothetical protein CAEBREN_04635 [Caenorhabditis brenneri]|uniref:G-protein coupled receptors family 1 profile domain-containing protein n=1 Tax=Caenorhabditis brenneri TaxID=135651 RepID=G0P0G9_CAEBE|nr:hypothetical protein CAEBREN_04635 [Caenorhabditis brenneri]
MAMIAFMDICSLSYVIDRESIRYIQTIFLCYSESTDYILMMSQIATDYIRNYGRRCSTWLSLSITTLRALVIRYPMNTRIGKLSNPKAAFYIIIGVIFTIIPINIIDAFRLKVSLENESFGCGFGFGPRYYSVDWTDFYLSDSYFVRAMSKRIDGLVSKFFLSASTMCHMIICMLMSSQYRMNALMFVRAGYPLKEKKAEVTITVTQPN